MKINGNKTNLGSGVIGISGLVALLGGPLNIVAGIALIGLAVAVVGLGHKTKKIQAIPVKRMRPKVEVQK